MLHPKTADGAYGMRFPTREIEADVIATLAAAFDDPLDRFNVAGNSRRTRRHYRVRRAGAVYLHEPRDAAGAS